MSSHEHRPTTPPDDEARPPAPAEHPDQADAATDVPAADGSTAHIRNPDGTPIDNPSG